MKKIIVSDFIERLKKVNNIKTNIDLSNFVEVDNTTISQWKKRNKIPKLHDIINKCDNIDLNWLLTGEGNPILKNNQSKRLYEPYPDEKREKFEETYFGDMFGLNLNLEPEQRKLIIKIACTMFDIKCDVCDEE